MNKFPKDFLFGAAASAPQTEGAAQVDGKSPSVWDKWFELEPERFFDQVGPETASNTYYEYPADCQRMKEMGLNSYRTSIAWTRLLPDGKQVNPQGVAFYRDYFQSLLDHGIEPIINLFHFDMPWWLMEKGGWELRESSDYFADYAQIAFETFGDLVKKWTTFNEPLVHIECGYLGDAHWPKVNNFKRALQVGYHTLLAHAKAVERFKNFGPTDGEIGIILNLSPIYPRSQTASDRLAQKRADLIYTRSFLDPVVKGVFPQELRELLMENQLLPVYHKEDSGLFSCNTVDFLGVNYYQPLRVKGVDRKVNTVTSPSDWASYYDWPEKKINPHRGWEIYPQGLYDLAIRLKNDYGNLPWYVSENGMGVSKEEQFIDQNQIVQDTYRIEFLREHLEMLNQAIAEGCHCFGYHMWTFVDCWSWLNAYKNRYGFYRVDITNQYLRTPKASALWLKEYMAKNKE